MRRLLRALFIVVALLSMRMVDAADSLRWLALREQFFKNAIIVDDLRVQVIGPKAAEDSMNVPISIRMDGFKG